MLLDVGTSGHHAISQKKSAHLQTGAYISKPMQRKKSLSYKMAINETHIFLTKMTYI